MLTTKLSAWALLLGAVLAAGCSKKDEPVADPIVPGPPAGTVGPLVVNVENVVGAEPLVLDTRSYTSPQGEPFTVSAFRYYLSNFRLHRADSSVYDVPESYFLVSEERPGSPRPTGKRITLPNIPVGEYTRLSFLIGVDEERNTAGAQTGALSPDNNMFWTWSQGYIFLQLEGNSPASGETGNRMLSYHIGDFRRPNNLRVVAPPLPAGTPIRVKAGSTPEVQLQANLLRLFVGRAPEVSFPVRFGPFWYATGGMESGQLATNYSGSGSRDTPGTNSMFTVTAVRGQ